MAVDVMELERRLDATNAELRELRRRVDALTRPERAPLDGTILEWLAAIRAENATLAPFHDGVLRELGAPDDIPHLSPREVQELMRRDGINPSDCIASRDIARMREE